MTNKNLSYLTGKRIAIFGASGLVGKYLLSYLENNTENTEILAFSHTPKSRLALEEDFQGAKNRIVFLDQDVLKEISVDKEVDIIFHAASPADPVSYSTNPVGTILSNVLGTKNILEWARKFKATTPKFIYLSSGEVYGDNLQNETGFFETDQSEVKPFDPRSCYPIGKIAAENLCVAYHKQFGMHINIARLCHTYGPTISQTSTRADAQFLRLARAKRPIVMKSKGEQVRSYCYVSDVCSALLTIVEKAESGEFFNISNKNSVISIRQYADILANIAGVPLVFELPDEIEQAGYTKIKKAILNSGKLEKLGWRPKVNIEEGLKFCLFGEK